LPVQFEPPGDRLSQGDLLRASPSVWVESLNPLVRIDNNRYELRRETPQTLDLSRPHPANARAVREWAVVLTHDCELDNAPERAPILLGLVRPLENMTDEILESFRQNTRNRSLYLPAEGGLDRESFLDLRRKTSVRRSILPDLDVAASMNEDGRLMLREQLFRFFVHKVLPDNWVDWEEDEPDGG
jgi:hypothetical protein